MAAEELAQWVHNKLGSTDDLWSAKSICSQLSAERLNNLQECFHALLPHVKIKLLLSFLHLSRRNIEQWKDELNSLIQLTSTESDAWVSTIAEILRNFPESGSITSNLHSTNAHFTETLIYLKKTVKKASKVMLPLECQYLNKQALHETAGQVSQLERLFQIKRKPKSAALRAEIMTKAPMPSIRSKRQTNAVCTFRSSANAHKLNTSSVTVTPLGNTWVTNRPGQARKDGGGIKLLDISEMPVGSREAKKRRRLAELEVMEQHKKLKEEVVSSAMVSVPVSITQTVTPDYAAGLIVPAIAKITNSTLLSVASTLKVQGPTYFPSAALIRPTQQSSLSIGVIGPLSNQQQARKVCLNPLLASYISSNGSASAAQTAKSLNPITLDSTTQMITAARPANVSPAMRSVPSMVLAARTLGHCRPIVTQASPQIFTRQAGVQLVTVAARTPNAPHTQGVMVVPGSVAVQVRLPGPSMSVAYHTSEGGASKLVPQQTGSSVCSVSMDLSKEKKLLLSQQRVKEASEIFLMSNKVTRPEKALILGFMAGLRENPCPKQGNILNIKLNEEEEERVVQADGTTKAVMVETYFQMNYTTGEWKRFTRKRDIISAS